MVQLAQAPLLSFPPTPEDLAGHQDDCGLLSQLLQSHSCNSTMFFNPKELYKYMSIYSSVTV